MKILKTTASIPQKYFQKICYPIFSCKSKGSKVRKMVFSVMEITSVITFFIVYGPFLFININIMSAFSGLKLA